VPSFSDIADRVVVAGFDGTSFLNQYNNDSVRTLFAQAFEGSVSLAAQVTSWLNNPANFGKNITITYVPPSDPNSPGYAFSGTGEIFLTPDRCDDLLYITENGNAIQHSALSVLVHEIGHAITGVRDDPTYSNLKGDNIAQYVNDWYGELSIPKEAGYLSRAFVETGILTVDKDYTENSFIENAIVDPGGQRPEPLHRLDHWPRALRRARLGRLHHLRRHVLPGALAVEEGPSVLGQAGRVALLDRDHRHRSLHLRDVGFRDHGRPDVAGIYAAGLPRERLRRDRACRSASGLCSLAMVRCSAYSC